MTTSTKSPLAMLLEQSLQAVSRGPAAGSFIHEPQSFKHTVEGIAGGLLVAMGYREIAEDLGLEAVALLSAATIAGLKVIEATEPGLYRSEDALFALEDLLRRTSPAAG